jgi:putrescine aminotransferase
MITYRQELFLKHQAQTTDFPLMLEIDRAEGVFMFAPDGKQYIDLISGIGVSNVGHRHPKVVEAIKSQTDKYLHLMVYGEVVQSPQVQLSAALASTLPDPLEVVYLVNSGSEAVEGALKLAKRYTGRAEIISCIDAYHGSSQGALSVSGNEKFKSRYRPLIPGVRHIRFNDLEDLAYINTKTAAIIIESVQGEAGVRIADASYFKALRKRCDETGTLLIVDEIQSGFGRTGTFWAFQHYDFIPDIVVSAKGMGGGMPIGAFIASAELFNVIRNQPILGHITTFGGHPVSAAASLATLQIITAEGFLDQIDRKAQRFIDQLSAHTAIGEIRNKGLMMAADMGSFEQLKKTIDKAIELGVLTDWFLYCDNSMRIAPPLTISFDEIDQACELIGRAIKLA